MAPPSVNSQRRFASKLHAHTPHAAIRRGTAYVHHSLCRRMQLRSLTILSSLLTHSTSNSSQQLISQLSSSDLLHSKAKAIELHCYVCLSYIENRILFINQPSAISSSSSSFFFTGWTTKLFTFILFNSPSDENVLFLANSISLFYAENKKQRENKDAKHTTCEIYTFPYQKCNDNLCLVVSATDDFSRRAVRCELYDEKLQSTYISCNLHSHTISFWFTSCNWYVCHWWIHQERRIDNGGGDDDNTIKDISNNMNAHFVVRRGGAFWTAGNRIIWTQFLFNIKYCIIRRLKARLKSSWALPPRSTRAHKNIHTQMKWVRRQGCRSHTVR